MSTDSRPDRRVRRTRDLLRRALIDLILEKGYDSTTVQDILDRADVGRSTFYAHYPTKDQLLLSGLDDLRLALDRTADAAGHDQSPPSLLMPLWPLFDHAAGKHRLFRAMLGSRAAPVAVRAGRRMLSQTLTAHLRARIAVQDPDELKMAVCFLVDGLLGVFTWWLESQPHLSADVVYTRFERLATQGLEPFLTHENPTGP